MKPKHSGYIIVLEDGVREDSTEEESILNALRMVKGVHSVVPITESQTSQEDHNTLIAKAKLLDQVKRNLLNFIPTVGDWQA